MAGQDDVAPCARTLHAEGLEGSTRARLIFTDHHESHAASAFFPSPYEQAAIVTLDGVGSGARLRSALATVIESRA